MTIQEAEKTLISKCISGSRAYGLHTETSDYDFRGIFTVDPTWYWRSSSPPEQVGDVTQDYVIYSLNRFLKLAADGNPNVLEILFMPKEHIRHDSDIWQQVVDIRQAFVSKRLLNSFAGYAVSQIKRARGQRKLIHNPQPEKKPTKEDFMWHLPMQMIRGLAGMSQDGCSVLLKVYGCLSTDMVDIRDVQPFRCIRLSDYEESRRPDLREYVAVSMEHCKDAYRLYLDEQRRGVFRGEDEQIVSESVPKDREWKTFRGILIYNREAYEQALKKWHEYHNWLQVRNPERWKDQENGAVDFDCKNIMHCMRLLYSAENIILNREPIVDFRTREKEHARLTSIRAGKLSYDEIIVEAEERLAKIDEAKLTCDLPGSADHKKIDDLAVRINQQLLTRNWRTND